MAESKETSQNVSEKRKHTEETEEGVFHGLRAWFSQSVSEKRKFLWVDEGGIVTENPDDAKLLFSEDAGHQDTRNFYGTKAYLQECLTIYHPSYIEQILEESPKVRLDRYILPSMEIQKEMTELGLYEDGDTCSDDSASDDEFCATYEFGVESNSSDGDGSCSDGSDEDYFDTDVNVPSQ